MSVRLSDARRRALRALAEGAAPTLDLLADAAGVTLDAVRKLAVKGQWALRADAGAGVTERVRVLALALLQRVEALAVDEEGGRISKAEIDGLVAMIRGLEKIDEIMRPEDAGKSTSSWSREDEDLAAVLDCLDSRIVELARELAAQLVAQERGLPGSVAEPRRMAS
ncbi:hypothetical protein [Mesorhizobium sp. SP-1A]|uniref:hypothetical protein n=1 Tax=Mesorhizobium sp. SP-1A TaxID=3077840 RepID=UPI0028F6D79B|nr:hypothetical protein [Mesorhizobium sp. SP-1A]